MPGLHCSWKGKNSLFSTQQQPKPQTYLDNLLFFASLAKNQANKSGLFP